MAITDKNRKLLWGRSGNLCAICRVSLAIGRTSKDAESVVGEECHIVSAAPNGPRYEAGFPSNQAEELNNLILLCTIHHKMIDDQKETYTAPVVRAIKSNHEDWVKTKLHDKPAVQPVRVHRIRENIPNHLPRVTSARELLALASGVSAHSFGHDDNLSTEEVELVGGFLQQIADWIDYSSDLEPLDRVRATKGIQDSITELETKSFFVFAGRETQRLEGGIGAAMDFPVLHLSVNRTSNPGIQNFEPEKQRPPQQN